MNRGMLVKN